MTPLNLSKPGVFLAMPSYDHKWHVKATTGIMQVVHAGKIKPFEVVSPNGTIARSRNLCANQFLADKRFDRLVFVDADVVWEPWMLEKLISCDLDFIAALYPKKTKELHWVVEIDPKLRETGELPVDERGFSEVRKVGMGFCSISRKCLETLIAKFGEEIGYTEHQPKGVVDVGQKMYAFFQERPEYDPIEDAVHWLSEDFFFCRLLERAGIPVLVDRSFYCGHEGMIEFPLALPE